MKKPRVTERFFETDGRGRLLPQMDIMFVCPPDGKPRTGNPRDPQTPGAADLARLVKTGDYVMTGFINNQDVVIHVWRVTHVRGRSAECILAHRLGASGNWKPDLGRRSVWTAQIEAYAEAIPDMCKPVRQPGYAGRR